MTDVLTREVRRRAAACTPTEPSPARPPTRWSLRQYRRPTALRRRCGPAVRPRRPAGGSEAGVLCGSTRPKRCRSTGASADAACGLHEISRLWPSHTLTAFDGFPAAGARVWRAYWCLPQPAYSVGLLLTLGARLTCVAVTFYPEYSLRSLHCKPAMNLELAAPCLGAAVISLHSSSPGRR